MEKQRESQRIADELSERETHWKTICPFLFQDTDPAKFKPKARAAYKEVMAWQYAHRKQGLALVGPTGAGKSRTLYDVIKSEYLAGRSIAIIDHGSNLEYAAKFSRSGQEVYEWVEKLSRVDVLGMDDIFKPNMSAGWESALFTIVENRMAAGRPMIVSTQDIGESLEKRMSADRGAAIVRRLRECCETISFS